MQQLSKAKIDNDKVRKEFEMLHKRLSQLEGRANGHAPPSRAPEPLKENSDPEMSTSSWLGPSSDNLLFSIFPLSNTFI